MQKFKICTKCNLYSDNNYDTICSKCGLSLAILIPNDCKCALCDKQCKNANSYRQHIIRCSKNDCKISTCFKVKRKFGIPPWNKGLTKNTDIRIKKQGETFTANLSSGKRKHNWCDKKHTDATKLKISN